MKHTKGNWKEVSAFVMSENNAVGICSTCSVNNLPLEEQLANAQLIAAAPDLLKACEAQHQAIDRLFALLIEKDEKFFPSKSGQPWEAIQQGNAAIAKVKGN